MQEVRTKKLFHFICSYWHYRLIITTDITGKVVSHCPRTSLICLTINPPLLSCPKMVAKWWVSESLNLYVIFRTSNILMILWSIKKKTYILVSVLEERVWANDWSNLIDFKENYTIEFFPSVNQIAWFQRNSFVVVLFYELT